MALMRDMSTGQICFMLADGQDDDFLVTRFRGTEGLCQLYRFEIELTTDLENVAFDDVIGKAALLTIDTEGGRRWFHGIISRFEMTGEVLDRMYYRAELVPTVWLLTHHYRSRIFQNKTVKQIIAQVLDLDGIPSDRIRLSVQDGEPREYCVQYRETDYSFISRLMEEEGFRWRFEQTQEGHTFVVEDEEAVYKAIEGEPQLRFHKPTGLNVHEEHVYRYRLGQAVRPGAVVLDDFNFKNPRLSLQAASDSSRDTDLEFSDHPGEYVSQSEGARYAKIRAEEFESGRTLGVGMSNCHRRAAGRKFELTEHPSQPTNGEYLITSVTHQGRQGTPRSSHTANGHGILDQRLSQAMIKAQRHSDESIGHLAEGLQYIASRLGAGDQSAHREFSNWLYHAGQVSRDLPSIAAALGGNPQDLLSIPNLLEDAVGSDVMDHEGPVYVNRFECIPAEVTYRPPRVTPWPQMRGTQTARVVGPEGEEIYTDPDGFGRVKVQFNWDREGGHKETASCWIRVCQGMAGGNYGILFLPRVGQEVIVDFLEGNPDQPIIIGRVFNADHMPPYKLPDEKTKSVIKTHSSKGGGGTNEIRFEDLKDKEQFFIQAQRQMDTRVKASHFHTVGGSYHLLVGGTDQNGELAGELRELVHKAKHVHIKGELRTWVEENEGRAIGGDQLTEIQGMRSMSVVGDVVDLFQANHGKEVAATYSCVAACIHLGADGGIELKSGGSSIVISAGGIFIDGPMVMINSGAGPPVAPAPMAGMSPPAAEDAGAADRSEPGADTSYTGGEVLEQSEVPEDFEHVHRTWIEFLVRDAGENPVPNERYRIKLTDGTIMEGRTDGEGLAKFEDQEPGLAEIQLPDRDDHEWRRVGAEVPPERAEGAAGGGA